MSNFEGGVRLLHSDGRDLFEPFGSSFRPNWRESGVQLTEKQAVLWMHDIYLRDNPQQHIHCMSPDSECVSLIMYAITIKINLCNFLAIWAILSILLDTQSNTLQYVKSLQQAVNNYYNKHPTDFMSRLEHQASDIMKAMYDSINNKNCSIDNVKVPQNNFGNG